MRNEYAGRAAINDEICRVVRCMSVSCLFMLAAAAQSPSGVRSNEATAMHQQGQTLASEGRLAEAEVPLRSAVALAPDDVKTLTLLAEVESRLGDAKDAAKLFRRVVVLQPGSSTAHLDLAFALADSGDSKGALIEVAEAIKLDPKNAAAHLNRGRLLGDAGQTADARREFQRAAQLDPRSADVSYFWGVMEKDDHRPQAAAALFRKVVEQQPNNGRAYGLLAQELDVLGLKDAAIAAWQHAVSIDPSSEEATYALALALRDKDSSAAAQMFARFHQLQLEKQATDEARNLGNQAYAAMQQQSWANAITTLQQAIGICGHCAIGPDLHQRLGLAECHKGDLAAGERELRMALKLNPNDQQTIGALHWIDDHKTIAASP